MLAYYEDPFQLIQVYTVRMVVIQIFVIFTL